MIPTDHNRTRITEEPTVCLIGQDDRSKDAVIHLVESQGLEFEAFESAEDFLEAFDFINVAFIVLDFDLPGMCGLELQVRLFSQEIDIPVIVTCGRASSNLHSVVTAFKAGAIDVLQAPFSAHQMAEPIRKAIERRVIQQQCTSMVVCQSSGDGSQDE